MLDALGLAQSTASSGTQSALDSARGTLDRTFASLRPSLERVLGVLGVHLPTPPATAAPTATTPAGSSTPDSGAAFQPVQSFLGGMETLWQKLLGRGGE
jgi:hypothetical protein